MTQRQDAVVAQRIPPGDGIRLRRHGRRDEPQSRIADSIMLLDKLNDGQQKRLAEVRRTSPRPAKSLRLHIRLIPQDDAAARRDAHVPESARLLDWVVPYPGRAVHIKMRCLPRILEEIQTAYLALIGYACPIPVKWLPRPFLVVFVPQPASLLVALLHEQSGAPRALDLGVQ